MPSPSHTPASGPSSALHRADTHAPPIPISSASATPPTFDPTPLLLQIKSKTTPLHETNDAWTQLVRHYTPRLYGLLVKQSRNRELAEELTQMTFVKIFEKIDTYDEQGKFEPWLFRVALNSLRDEARRKKRHALSIDTAKHPTARGQSRGAASPESDTPLQSMEKNEQLEQLSAAIETLPDADREILYLRHTAGLGFAEIAQTLNQPLGTVLARSHRVLAKLKKRFPPPPLSPASPNP